MAGINLGPDHDLAIRLQWMEDNIRALSTRDVLQNANIGAGGLLVNGSGGITVTGGGSLTVTGTGMLNVASGGLNSAGSISAVADITAGGRLVSAGDGQIGGILRVPSIYTNSITSSYRIVYTTSVDGALGFNLSSRDFKQDIADFKPDLEALRKLRIITFRYIQAVEAHGDQAAIEAGLIAEEVDELGLTWLVDYDAETGKPNGIKFDRLALAALAVAQDHEQRLLRLEKAA